MAEIRVEPKRGSMAWLWIVLLVLVALAAWWWYSNRRAAEANPMAAPAAVDSAVNPSPSHDVPWAVSA
ncbi:MAG TPA: hypothetical protein VFY16_01250 [Gemmatimonadaceae bacterium]|jgi:hypothetical protein|nr:hypothetical protein [Gemmatimonadaceae bacterium]